MFGLAYLISPHKTERFLSDQFGYRALVIAGEADKFSELFGWGEINRSISYGSTYFTPDRLIMDQKDLGRSGFAQLGHWIDEGATYVINSLQNRDPVIDQFTRILSGELNQQVSVNCYISAPEKQGFETHYDAHDVFVVQLHGNKEWSIFLPTVAQPVEEMRAYVSPKPETDPYLEHRMTPGDVLYIPRGHWHHAVASEISVHLTVGIKACTPIDFLRWFTDQEMWADEKLRKDFPVIDSAMFLGGRDSEILLKFIDEFKADLFEKLSSESFQQHFVRFVMERNTLHALKPISLPDQFLLEESISLDTEFEVPLGQKIILQTDPEKNVAIVIARGITVELEGSDQGLLSAIFHQDPDLIQGRKIKQKLPDTEDGKIYSVLLKLLEGGVIQLKTNSSR